MSINTQSLFESKCALFGQSKQSTRFTNDFLTAVNRTLNDLLLHTQYSADALTDIYSDIDLNAKLESAVSMGVDFHLLKLGQQSAMDLNQSRVDWRDSLKTLQMEKFREAETDETLSVKLGDLSD